MIWQVRKYMIFPNNIMHTWENDAVYDYIDENLYVIYTPFDHVIMP